MDAADRIWTHLLSVAGVLAVAIVATIGLTLARPTVARADAPSFVPDTSFGFHSMLYLNSPTPLKQLMFSEAQAAGVSWIRVDISLGALENPYISHQMWADVSQYEQLSEQYGIRVLADLPDTDASLTTCSAASDDPTRCGIFDPAALVTYGQQVGALAAATAGVIDDFEIINEPDSPASFTGTPQQYAWMLRTAYDAIHQADPAAQVAIGGLMNPADESWVAQVFATPGADATQAFDIANVHLRDPLDELPGEVGSWRSFFAQYGDSAKPLWVTETGYAADPTYQEDPAFLGIDPASGLLQQAAYIEQLVPTLMQAGVAKFFVTERDNLTGEAASEGLIGGDVTDADADAGDIDPVLRPSFAVYQQMAQAAIAGIEDPPPPATAPAAPAVSVVKKAVRKTAKKHHVERVCRTKTVDGTRRRVCGSAADEITRRRHAGVPRRRKAVGRLPRAGVRGLRVAAA